MRAERRRERESNAGFCGSSAHESGSDKLDVAAADFLRELLTNEYGITVLRASRRSSSTQSSTQSQAASQTGTSAFAQAFSEALGGRADQDKDGLIHLQEISRYVNQRVQELTAGKQMPVIERPRGVRSFPLAKPPASDGKPAPNTK